QKGSIISTVVLPTTEIIEPIYYGGFLVVDKNYPVIHSLLVYFLYKAMSYMLYLGTAKRVKEKLNDYIITIRKP
ncbi:hypothetical protein, partial [Streptococcus suis]